MRISMFTTIQPSPYLFAIILNYSPATVSVAVTRHGRKSPRVLATMLGHRRTMLDKRIHSYNAKKYQFRHGAPISSASGSNIGD
jgi:hypothetical protein